MIIFVAIQVMNSRIISWRRLIDTQSSLVTKLTNVVEMLGTILKYARIGL